MASHTGALLASSNTLESHGERPAKQDCSSPFKEAANLTWWGSARFTGRGVCWLLASKLRDRMTLSDWFFNRKTNPLELGDAQTETVDRTHLPPLTAATAHRSQETVWGGAPEGGLGISPKECPRAMVCRSPTDNQSPPDIPSKI